MNFFISILLACFLVFLFQFIEYKRFRFVQLPDYLFLFLLISCAYVLPPVQHIGVWIGFLPLLYCVLDDLHTKTGFIVLPLVSLIIFLILSFNWLSLLLSFLYFLFFYVAARLSNESLVGMGDAFFVLPLAYLLGFDAPIGLLLAGTIAGMIFSAVRFFRSEPLFAFFPALFIGSFIVYTGWHASLFLAWSFGLFTFFSLIHAFLRHRKRN